MATQLLHGDCLELMRTLPDASVDAVITDPPYCSGGSLEAHKNTKAQGLRSATVGAEDFRWFASDNMNTSGLVWLLRAMMTETRRLLRPNSPALVFTDWRMVPHLAPALESCGMRYRNMLIWDKGNAGLGHGFKPAYEVVLEFTNGTTEYQSRTGQNILRVARVPAVHKEHQTQKPVDLIAQLLRVAVRPGGVVLDPFMGSGTTGVACVQEGREFIGIEREASYYAIAERRIAAAQPPLFQEVAD